MKLFFLTLSLLLFASVNFAQSREDVCYVYVVDVEKANKASENYQQTGNKEAKAMGQTTFPKFRTEFEEENLTTKHYNFPDSKFIITASVYYTDESLASHPYGKYQMSTGSILIGIMVSKTARESAIASETPNSAITEVTYDEYTNMVRAKQYVKVNGKLYLLGIQCDCAAKRNQK